jgi:hypothetical protein
MLCNFQSHSQESEVRPNFHNLNLLARALRFLMHGLEYGSPQVGRKQKSALVPANPISSRSIHVPLGFSNRAKTWRLNEHEAGSHSCGYV